MATRKEFVQTMKDHIEELKASRQVNKAVAFELNQCRVSEAAVCRALGELSTRIEELNVTVSGQRKFLEKQTELQEHIAKTKSKQSQFYSEVKKDLEEIKSRLPVTLVKKQILI